MQHLPGNQRPDPLNMLLVLRLPREIHLRGSSSHVPRLPSFLGMLHAKPSCFAYFWQGAESLGPAARNNIWTSKRGPALRCIFSILTSKCASRHNCAHLFNISSSKSAPSMVCFVNFDFETCFVPQWREFCRFLNFQKRSGVEVY